MNEDQLDDLSIFSKTSSRENQSLLCAVCGDHAESKHYGALACNGCKGFFRRTVWNSRLYHCRRINQCRVVKEIRKACKACRFKKCLAVGMNPKELQGTRIIKNKAELKLQKCELERKVVQVIELPKANPPVTTLMFNPCFDRSHPEALVMLDRHILQRIDPPSLWMDSNVTGTYFDIPFAAAFQQPSLVSRRTEIPFVSDRIATVSDMAESFHRNFVLFADWLNEFSDFQMLPKNVQLILAKTRCSSYSWAVCAWRTQRTGCPGISYPNGSFFPQNPQLKCIPDDKDITSLFLEDLVGSMKSLDVDEAEYILLKVINLFSDDAEELSDFEKKLIRNNRDKYLEVLATYIKSRFPQFSEVDVACRIGQLVLLLASLTHIAYLGNDNISFVDTLKIANFGGLTCELHKNHHPEAYSSAIVAWPKSPSTLSLSNDSKQIKMELIESG